MMCFFGFKWAVKIGTEYWIVELLACRFMGVSLIIAGIKTKLVYLSRQIN